MFIELVIGLMQIFHLNKQNYRIRGSVHPTKILCKGNQRARTEQMSGTDSHQAVKKELP